MANYPSDGDAGRRLRQLRVWWRWLPTANRMNVGLYALAGVALAALLIEIVRGDRPPRVATASATPFASTTITLNAPTTSESAQPFDTTTTTAAPTLDSSTTTSIRAQQTVPSTTGPSPTTIPAQTTTTETSVATEK